MHGLLVLGTLVLAGAAASILVVFLYKRPALGLATKLWLFAGLGVLPILAAGSGNIAGFQSSTKVEFCNGCHVMNPYVADARDPKSDTLAAIHARNGYFGQDACYTCHEDYSMFGAVTTKMQGMKHMQVYYTTYRNADPMNPQPPIKLYEPFKVTNCTHCHSLTAPTFRDVDDHKDAMDKILAGKMVCNSSSCHDHAHPNFSEQAKEAMR